MEVLRVLRYEVLRILRYEVLRILRYEVKWPMGVFFFMKTKKMRDARTSRFQPVARRDLCYASENALIRYCILGDF